MENTLYPKDVILVNKLKYGPNLPRSPYEIPWINIYYLLQNSSKEAETKKVWPVKRLKGLSSIKQGDVMVFKKYNSDVVFVKRCAAIAGDTLKIVDGEIYTNKQLYNETDHVRNTYAFKIKEGKQFYKAIDSLDINTRFHPLKNEEQWKEGELSYLEVAKLKTLKGIDSLQIKPDVYILDQINLFPKSKDRNWTLDNYGDVVIPKAGMKIQLTDETFKLYKRIMKRYENVNVIKNKNIFLVDGKVIRNYTFKKNYYFMMGDNRKNSKDSRYFGFTPEERIISKVSCILFSNKDNHFQWNRLFKGV